MLFDPTFRRSDSDRFRSRNAWRVRGLVLALGMVLISIRFASQPENWRWLTNEPRARPQADATRAARSNVAETADDEPLGRDEIRAVPADDHSAKRSISVEVGSSRSPADVHLPSELFDNVSESRIGIRQDEREAYFTVLAKARDLRLPVLEAAARRDIGYVELFNDPEAHRGEVVTVEGQLRRLVELPAGDNSHGFQTLYEGWLFTEDSGANPFRLVFSRLPEGISTGERVRLSARFTGYFFKRSGYVNKAGDLHSVPLLLGKTIRWEPATPLETGVSTRTMFTVIGLVAGLCIGLVMLMRQVSSSDHQFQRRRRQLAAPPASDAVPPADVEVIDPREELRRLSEEQQGVGSQRDSMMLTESVWLSTLSAAERSELIVTDGDLLTNPDVLVVGGGIVGLATAYFLTELGARVQVIEAGSLASGATGASAGAIWPNEQGPSHPPAYQPLAFIGRDLWGRLAVRPGFDFDWRVNGFLNLNAERFAPSAEAFAAQAHDAGFSLKPVDADQIARLEPQLARGFREGLHYPSEAHLHPIKASLSLARVARRAGCRIRTGTRAIGVEVSANRIVAVNTTAGRIEPRHVVATTGWTVDWVGACSPLPSGGEGLGVRGPLANTASQPMLRPVSGQMIATDPQSPLLKCSIGGRVLVIQLKTGEIVVGASLREDSSLEPDPAVTVDFIAAAREIVPALRDIPFRRVWCGVRPATPDALPILDRSPTADNLWLNCGHFRNGLLLSPACGKLLAEWLVKGEPSADVSGLALNRFAS